MAQLGLFFKFLYAHKFKVVWLFLSVALFVILLFPFDDLSDLMSAQISKLTGNKVYLSVDGMKLSVLQPGVKFRKVFVEGNLIPSLSADELTISPSIAALINKKPLGTISANGIFKGQIEINVKTAPKSDAGNERQKFELTASKISLADLQTVSQIPMALKGVLNLSATAITDLTFQEQPDADVVLSIDKFELPTSNVETAMGPVTVPELKLSHVQLKGRLSGGNFKFEEGTIGRDGDDLKGTIKGSFGLLIKNNFGNMSPVFGSYDISVDLNVKRSLQDSAALFLVLLDPYKTTTADGAHYQFRVSAAAPGIPPQFGAIR